MTEQKKKTNARKLVLRIVILSLVGALIGFQFYLLNAEKLVGDAMPMPFGVGMSVVLSGSMEPELSVDDLIVVKEHEQYGVNDVVVFLSQGSLVVHRIIEITEDGIITKGDANNTPDDPISPESIKGKVVYALPFVGKAVNFIKSPIGIIVVLSLAIFLMELSFRREKQKDSDDIEKIKEEIRRLQAQNNQNTENTPEGDSEKSDI